MVDPHTGLFDTLGTFRHTLDAMDLPDRGRGGRPFTGGCSRVEHAAAFLFIDGGHTDEAAQRDFDGWVKWVDAGGGLVITTCSPTRTGGRRPTGSTAARWTAVRSRRFRSPGSLRVLQRVTGSAGESVD